MADLIVDFGEWQEFVDVLSSAGLDFKKEAKIFLEGIGIEFLRRVQEQIEIKDNIETSLLIESFSVGNENNFWDEYGNLKIEVGSTIKYADWVNTGHHLKNGEWWEGSHYFDIAEQLMDKDMKKYVDAKFQLWLEEYLSKFLGG